MGAGRLSQRRWAYLPWVVAAWVLQGLIAAQAQVWYALSAGEPVRWPDVIFLTGRTTLIWIPLSVVAIEIVRAADHERIGRWRAGLAHLAGASFACLVDAGFDIWSGRVFELQQWTGKYFAAVFRQANSNLFNYAAVVAICLAVEHARRSRERLTQAARLEGQLARAKLDLLRMQLQPHFLFNTLHGISAVVYDRPQDAERMLTRLGELLRASADDLGRVFVSLDDEVTLLESYLDIERTRFQDRLTVEISVPDDCRAAAVPNLILQPLVENAIKHGVAVHRGNNRIDITARRLDGELEITVANTGGQQPIDPTAFRDGVGLANTRQRLEEIYRGRHRLELRPRHPSGLEVTVRFPLQTLDEVETLEST